MKDPSLTFERIRDVAQKSNVIHRDFKDILIEIEKDFSGLLHTNKDERDKSSQRCIYVKDLLMETSSLPIHSNPNPFIEILVSSEAKKSLSLK
jgi:hypothetical protein